MNSKIIAVDFDGTLCENNWPGIGEPRQAVIDYVLDQQRQGAKLILWTNRTGKRLGEAVNWCSDHGIEFDALNANLPEIIESFGGDCRKVFANEYIDDKAIPMPGERGLTEDTRREFDYIRERLGKPELLTQLAEESAELGQAALKLARIVRGENPARITYAEAYHTLVTELTDVCNAVDVLDEGLTERGVRLVLDGVELTPTKMTRWYKSLFGEEEGQ